ncbi:LytTR family DNA-binding domain-containing protein [Gilvibacter sediminis]|uniref:LytTR family DNA-binding domain-containing protein n=1 Tax=Gilvibacter sediminis TaxID=379071 RepID=UPI002350E891|nr:LytTR family DNA-binding domain-containing protein [Gilvibacter sediminis]MDC7998028.1 LytTR family DNA-binding domain-containing protein [Gilvibacter sediminis]
MNQIKTSFKPNFIIALLVGGWLLVFIMLVRPFQEEPLSLGQWMVLALGYSFIAMGSYVLIIPIQLQLYIRLKQWNFRLEALLVLLFFTIALMPSYLYHRSDVLNGLYELPEFLMKVFLPSAVVLTPLLIFARMYLIKVSEKEDQSVVIRGTYKMDYLKVSLPNLVCVSSAQNYVDVFFLDDGTLQKKTIRTSLKKVEDQVPELLRVHRSHLINTNHFQSWKNSKTLSLTQIEIPVSKNYKEALSTL